MLLKITNRQPVAGAVDIFDREKCTRKLEEMVEAMKGAVAMEIWVLHRHCLVSLYFRNGATRKARLQLSAVTMSSEQSRTRASNSVWFDYRRYAALFNHGTRQDFAFFRDGRESSDLIISFARNLGLAIAQNANLVECLRMGVEENASWLDYLRVGVDYRQLKKDMIFAQLFSLDVWKDAFPSLQRAYLIGYVYDLIDVSPQLMKHVRGMEQFHSCMQPQGVSPTYSDWLGSMIRNNVIEEVDFLGHLLNHPKMLDDTLRRVRSFKVDIESRTSCDRLAMSLERTKAEGDKLEGVSVFVPKNMESLGPTAVETILRLRPNLQVLEVGMLDGPRFIQVCQAVTSSTLTKFMCCYRHESSTRVEAVVAVVGELLQHSTIRVLQLRIVTASHHYNDFVQGIAEGLRTTRLRRFHLVTAFGRVSIGSMTKLYESVRENRSLLDIQLKGCFWRPWRFQCHHDLPHAPPCPFSFFEFLSSRNQYLSQLLMPYDFPVGLWPLILESASGDVSILYYLLTSQPHLIRGKAEGTAADKEWDVDGPARKCRRIA